MRILIGWLSFIGYFFNTVFWVVPIVFFALLKLIPWGISQKIFSYLIDGCAQCWVSVNSFSQNLLTPLSIELVESPSLSTKQWYMVISNHQSWVDILVLQRVFHKKIPFLKFFLKQELIFVPIIGLAWWALDFPFMKRYSKQFLAKNPHLKGKDVATTRKACRKFQHKPVSVMNFVEGTRFNQFKRDNQSSPHQNLLLPRAGGLSFAINAMEQSIDTILDVTIFYPDGIPTYWQFIRGEVKDVKVSIISQKITTELVGNYQDDPAFKTSFQQWLNGVWQQKQHKIEQLKMRISD